ncbi:MAG: hypothetical protein ACKOC8_11970 [Pirellulales bacterium]
MKRPGISFDKDAILAFLLAHVEKFVVAIVALGALGLAWGGLDALRLKSVKPDQTPDALRDFTARVNVHIDAASKPPADALPPLPRLAEAIEPWRPGEVMIAPPPQTALLDKPLFQELAKRMKPDVFAIEDLQAVAGVAVFPGADDPAGIAPPAQPQPQPTRKEPGPRGRGRGRPREESQPVEMPQATPAEAMPRGHIMPYVVVTGLVPVARQRAEFARCFGSAGFQDPRLDQPIWGQYAVERMTEGAGAERWERVKLQNVETFQQGGGQQRAMAVPWQPEILPPTFLLGPNEAEMGYVAGLPPRIDDAWGLDTVHPWFRGTLEKYLAERREGLAAAAEAEAIPLEAEDLEKDADDHVGDVLLIEQVQFSGDPDPQPAANLVAHGVKTADGDVTFEVDDVGTTTKPVFVFASQWARILDLDGGVQVDTPCTLRVQIEKIGATPVARILGIRYGEAADAEELVDPVPLPLAARAGFMAGGGGGEFGGAVTAGADFRLFRFVDTDVKPGQRYRYRVKFAVRNPNFGIDKQHLADPAAAKGEFLVSKESAATPAVQVPEPTAVVVRTLTKDEIKKLKRPKAGWYEVLVLGEGADTGNYALRSVITEPGGVANVDPSLNKPGDTRMRGEAIVTDRILVDVRGRQEEPGIGTAGEPLEMLFVDPATGRFEFVSAADSQAAIDRYRSTLPAIEDGRKQSGKNDPSAAPGPAANPFEPGRP